MCTIPCQDVFLNPLSALFFCETESFTKPRREPVLVRLGSQQASGVHLSLCPALGLETRSVMIMFLQGYKESEPGSSLNQLCRHFNLHRSNSVMRQLMMVGLDNVP